MKLFFGVPRCTPFRNIRNISTLSLFLEQKNYLFSFDISNAMFFTVTMIVRNALLQASVE